MEEKTEKPFRLGIFPVGLVYLGFLVILLPAVMFSWFFDLLRWILRFFGH